MTAKQKLAAEQKAYKAACNEFAKALAFGSYADPKAEQAARNDLALQRANIAKIKKLNPEQQKAWAGGAPLEWIGSFSG